MWVLVLERCRDLVSEKVCQKECVGKSVKGKERMVGKRKEEGKV